VQYRTLGRTGLEVSAIAFGAGPVSGWMAELTADEQCAVIRRALAVGINWFDTAAGYGNGQSESGLGRAFARLGVLQGVHLATKVRYPETRLDDIRGYTRESVTASLERLGVRRVTLLQLHNAVTLRRGDEPASLTPADVLGAGGVVEAFRVLQREGVVGFLGLTGTGQPAAMREVVVSGAFDTIQVPFNALNPSAGGPMPADFAETDYGNIIADCTAQRMGVFAIRVFAGGALLGTPPSAHTLKTPFFPLALYERDRRRAAALADLLPGADMKATAVRFALADARVSSAIIGFRSAVQVDEAVAALDRPALPEPLLEAVRRGIPSPGVNPVFMREAIELAHAAVARGGGPFGTVVVLDGQVIGRGWNQVTLCHDPTAHAEILAIRDACARRGTFRLEGAQMYSSCEPCPMCLGAILWAGITELCYGADRTDAAAAGFADDDFDAEVARAPALQRVTVRRLMRDEARTVFAAWLASPGRVPY
jgi:aryl-alcohol dehydrogenase-like predicted oxidoreductase/tRNA(Arg) A34 adenosine deaminase TadA